MGTDPRETPPGQWSAGNPTAPEGWRGQPLQPGQAPHPNQPQPGQYPPEHAPFARPPYGAPAGPPNGQQRGDPRWSIGQQPGYPPPGQQPWQQFPPQQGHPYPPHQGQPYPPGQVSPGYGPGNRPPGSGSGFSAGPPVPPTIGRRKKGSILPALIFGLLAIVLAGVAAYLYVQENDNTGPAVPTARPAENGYAQVQQALQDVGLSAEGGADLRGATSYSLFTAREPGQAIQIDGHDAWIYIFTGPDSVGDQEASTAAFSAEDAPPPVFSPSRTQITTGSPTLFGGSNVIILLSMDDSPGTDVTDKVQEAVESLP